MFIDRKYHYTTDELVTKYNSKSKDIQKLEKILSSYKNINKNTDGFIDSSGTFVERVQSFREMIGSYVYGSNKPLDSKMYAETLTNLIGLERLISFTFSRCDKELMVFKESKEIGAQNLSKKLSDEIDHLRKSLKGWIDKIKTYEEVKILRFDSNNPRGNKYLNEIAATISDMVVRATLFSEGKSMVEDRSGVGSLYKYPDDNSYLRELMFGLIGLSSFLDENPADLSKLTLQETKKEEKLARAYWKVYFEEDLTPEDNVAAEKFKSLFQPLAKELYLEDHTEKKLSQQEAKKIRPLPNTPVKKTNSNNTVRPLPPTPKGEQKINDK